MTDLLNRIRAAALALPEVEEQAADGQPSFAVAGTTFLTVRGDTLFLHGAEGGTVEEIVATDDNASWIEDRIAAAWEYAAPVRLLEAGGR